MWVSPGWDGNEHRKANRTQFTEFAGCMAGQLPGSRRAHVRHMVERMGAGAHAGTLELRLTYRHACWQAVMLAPASTWAHKACRCTDTTARGTGGTHARGTGGTHAFERAFIQGARKHASAWHASRIHLVFRACTERVNSSHTQFSQHTQPHTQPHTSTWAGRDGLGLCQPPPTGRAATPYR